MEEQGLIAINSRTGMVFHLLPLIIVVQDGRLYAGTSPLNKWTFRSIDSTVRQNPCR